MGGEKEGGGGRERGGRGGGEAEGRAERGGKGIERQFVTRHVAQVTTHIAIASVTPGFCGEVPCKAWYKAMPTVRAQSLAHSGMDHAVCRPESPWRSGTGFHRRFHHGSHEQRRKWQLCRREMVTNVNVVPVVSQLLGRS